MTVNAQIPVTGPTNGNGSNRNWSFDFKVLDATDMRLRITNADGTDPVVVSTGFTIDPQYLNNDAGGVVVYPIAPADPLPAGKVITRYREVPYTQPVRIGNQGGFFPKTHEDAIDRLEMQIQQVNEKADRAITVPVGSPVIDLDELQASVQEALNAADDAENSATAAADSANVATNAAALAAGSKDDAETAALAADASADAAAASASTAGTSATAAAGSASAAAGSATSAGNAATAAAGSASAAGTSATTAGNAATAAAGSATAAGNSATAAAASAATVADSGLGINVSAPLLADLDDQTAVSKHQYRVTAAGTVGTWPAPGPGNAIVEYYKFNSTSGKQVLTYNTGVGLRGREFVRTYDSSAWREWTEAVSSYNLRAPLTVPQMHFERSIPLNLWECGVYGHDTNPTVDETAGILAAVIRANAEKRDLAVPAAKYLCGEISMNGEYALRIYGVGGKPFFLPTAALIAAGGNLFDFRRPNGAGFIYNSSAAEPSTDIVISEDRIVFGASLGVIPGEYVGWTSNRAWYYDHRNQWWKGEFHEVAAAGGATITFKDATHDAYDVSAEVLTVHAWRASRLELHNLGFGRIEAVAPEGGVTEPDPTITAIAFNRCKKAVLDDIETYNFSGSHIAQRNNDGTTIRNYRGFGSGPFGDTGYGLSNLGCIYSHFSDILSGGMRRLVDFSGTGTEGMGPSRNCIVDGFFLYGGGRDATGLLYEPHDLKPSFGVGTHGPAEKITFRNGKATNVGRVGTARGRDITFENIDCYGWIPGECFQFYYGEGGTVRNCTYTSNDFGNKDQQGVAISGGRRCPDFIKFGLEAALDGDGLPNKWQTESLDTVIEGNVCDGLTNSFINFRPGQTGTLFNTKIKRNSVKVAGTSGDFFMFRNGTGASLVVSASEWWDNTGMPRGDSSIGAEHDDGTILFGTRIASGAFMQDRVSMIGPSTYRVRLGANSYARFKCMAPHEAASTQRRLTVTSQNGDPTLNFDGWIIENSNAPITLHNGGNVQFTDTPTNINGTFGTPSKVTIGLQSSGSIWLENRMGSTRVLDITVL